MDEPNAEASINASKFTGKADALVLEQESPAPSPAQCCCGRPADYTSPFVICDHCCSEVAGNGGL